MVTGFFDPTGLSTSYILLAEIPVRDIAIAATTKQCGGSKCSTEAEGQDNETKKRLDLLDSIENRIETLLRRFGRGWLW